MRSRLRNFWSKLQRVSGVTAMLAALVLLGAAFVVLALAYRQQGQQVQRSRQIVHQNQVTSDKRWCHLLLLIKSPPGPPPTTDAGRHFNDAVIQLFKDFDCG